MEKRSLSHAWTRIAHDPLASNVKAVAKLERADKRRKTRFDRIIDWVRQWASSPSFLLAHLVWFLSWIAFNSTGRAFDPYPYSLLTLVVSLEAIVLSSLLLMAQDRMTRAADRREQLDLQVDLLAEQELTAILNVVAALAERSGIDVKVSVPDFDRLRSKTDIEKLASVLEHEFVSHETR